MPAFIDRLHKTRECVRISEWRTARANGSLVESIAGKWWSLHPPAGLTEEEWDFEFAAFGNAVVLRNLPQEEKEVPAGKATPDGQGTMFNVRPDPE